MIACCEEFQLLQKQCAELCVPEVVMGKLISQAKLNEMIHVAEL